MGEDDARRRCCWVDDRLKLLQVRSLQNSLHKLPDELRAKVSRASPDERNDLGEPLVVAVVKHAASVASQLRYVNQLLNAKADMNLADEKFGRDALTYACIEHNVAVVQLLIKSESVSLKQQDRLGNTALMYCCINGFDELVGLLVMKLTQQFGLNVLRLANCMGNTAEDLAVINKHHKCARLVQRQRLHMVCCMHRQLAPHVIVQHKNWRAFTAVYKCVDRWKGLPRRKSACSAARESLAVQKLDYRKQSF